MASIIRSMTVVTFTFFFFSITIIAVDIFPLFRSVSIRCVNILPNGDFLRKDITSSHAPRIQRDDDHQQSWLLGDNQKVTIQTLLKKKSLLLELTEVTNHTCYPFTGFELSSYIYI